MLRTLPFRKTSPFFPVYLLFFVVPFSFLFRRLRKYKFFPVYIVSFYSNLLSAMAPWNFLSFHYALFANSHFKSNLSLSRFYLLSQYDFFQALKARLLKNGRGARSLVIFNNYLTFLKFTANVDPIWFLRHVFLTTYNLPFRIYTVKLSNRNYYFPGPNIVTGKQIGRAHV